MNGVTFGNIHSYHDLHLILAPFTPAPAEPQTNFLQIPGRDGLLDLTEANGEVKFNAREFVFTFTVAPGDTLTFDERVSAVSNALNGLRCKITLDRDPDYYWEGRCSVSEYKQDKNIGQIEVTAVVNPYKLKEVSTNSTIYGSSEKTYSITCDKMSTVPVFRCPKPFKIIFDGVEYQLNAGEHKVPSIRLTEGENIVKAILQDPEGVSNLYLSYLKGAL